MRKLLFLMLILFFFGSAFGQSMEITGYVKNLAFTGISNGVSNKSYFLNQTRLRLQATAFFGEHIQAEIWVDTELQTGSFVKTDVFKFAQAFSDGLWLDLGWRHYEEDKFAFSQRLFRATLTAEYELGKIVAGRQRIAWGTGFVWNPTDLLNPLNPQSFERANKPGVDALYGDFSFGEWQRGEIVIAPADEVADFRIAGRYGTHLGEFDVSVMAGKFGLDWVVGADFAGYLGSAGVRGEFSVTKSAAIHDYLRLVINVDYNFPTQTYVVAELYVNGAGKIYDELPEVPTAFGPAKFYSAVIVSQPISPLFSGSLYGIQNLVDGSGLIGPAVTWSVIENLDFSANVYLFYGGIKDEYQSSNDPIFFGSLQWYF